MRDLIKMSCYKVIIFKPVDFCHSVCMLHWPRASLVRCITACSLPFVSFKTVSFMKLLPRELSLLPQSSLGLRWSGASPHAAFVRFIQDSLS